MRILICSDGTDAADKPTRLGGLVAAPCRARVTLLGIAEQSEGEERLRTALQAEADLLGRMDVKAELVVRSGEPIHEIIQQTTAEDYDLLVIGARIKRRSGAYWRSQRSYELIKSTPPPVLVAAGESARLTSLLVCSGGKLYSDAAVEFATEIAACAGASITLLHVMAQPPAIYAALAHREESVEELLAGGSELGQNLSAQKERVKKRGASAAVRVRHGDVVDQIFAEQRTGQHDMIVVGSSRAHGALQQYIMGDVTREILNRADCAVLVARSDKTRRGFWAALKGIFAA